MSSLLLPQKTIPLLWAVCVCVLCWGGGFAGPDDPSPRCVSLSDLTVDVPSEQTLELEGRFERFCASVGLDENSEEGSSVAFRVYVDGRRKAGTHTMTKESEPDRLSVKLNGAERLGLIVEDRARMKTDAAAVWRNVFLIAHEEGAKPPRRVDPPPDRAPAIQAPNVLLPAFHYPITVGGAPGRPFLFRLPVSGGAPLRIQAKGLPEGLHLDPVSCIVSGIPLHPGTVRCSLQAKNSLGEVEGELIFRLGRDALALTPPMGWNSWNILGCEVDQNQVMRTAEALLEQGLASRGYQYVVVDDCWMGKRDARGVLSSNERFPDLSGMADELHARGLKLGLYSSPGPETCQGHTGSYLHEREDAVALGLWGVDYFKYDWCSYQDLLPEFNREKLMWPYLKMRSALDGVKRDIVYSVCQYGMGAVWEWGALAGANLWRTTGDISDTWSRVEGIGFSQNGKEVWAGLGHWNDPDMLVLGRVGWGKTPWETRLTQNEQITHMTLWSLLAAPLFLGCDLEQMEPFTRSLLLHEEVLAVDQDPLGVQASRKEKERFTEVWARPLWDGTLAVGLFNRGWMPASVTAHWGALGLKGELPVRDLWLREDLGIFEESFTARVPRHGAILLKLGESVRDYETLARFLESQRFNRAKGWTAGSGVVSPGGGGTKGASAPSFQ